MCKNLGCYGSPFQSQQNAVWMAESPRATAAQLSPDVCLAPRPLLQDSLLPGSLVGAAANSGSLSSQPWYVRYANSFDTIALLAGAIAFHIGLPSVGAGENVWAPAFGQLPIRSGAGS